MTKPGGSTHVHSGLGSGQTRRGVQTRRDFLRTGSAATAGIAGLAVTGCRPSPAQQAATGAAGVPAPPVGDRILLQNGCVLSLDPSVGDFDRADVLIENGRIADVRPDLASQVGEDTWVVDASDTIVMPGFVDTHRHMWQGALRNILPNGLLSDYTRDLIGAIREHFRPEDVRVGDLVSALGAINAGVTTVLDWSHIANSPAHADAAIDGLAEAGIRAVYAFGSGAAGPENAFPRDIDRLRRERFASADQLVTLALAAFGPAEWVAARAAEAPITLHVSGSLAGMADAMGPDVTYIHCNDLDEESWQRIADTGGGVSISCPIEMEMGHGVPVVQAALDHGLRPSLSVDVETEMPGEMFTQMRSVFTLQRMQALERQRRGEPDPPELLTVRDVIEFATVNGALVNHLGDTVGTLTPGKAADVILLRANAINVMPVNNVYGAVVLGMDTSNVDSVFIGGRTMKWQGGLVDVDLDRIGRNARASRDHLLEAVGWAQTILGGELPGH